MAQPRLDPIPPETVGPRFETQKWTPLVWDSFTRGPFLGPENGPVFGSRGLHFGELWVRIF